MLSGRLAVMVAGTLAFVIVRRVLGLVGLGPTPDAKDVEIAVLRHQLMVVRRQMAPAAVRAARSAGVGDVRAVVAPRSVAGVRGDAIDAAALAPGGGRPAVDGSAHRPSPARSARRGGRTGAAACKGELPLGVSADRRGVPQARRAGVSHL